MHGGNPIARRDLVDYYKEAFDVFVVWAVSMSNTVFFGCFMAVERGIPFPRRSKILRHQLKLKCL